MQFKIMNEIHFEDRLCYSTLKLVGDNSTGTGFIFKYNFKNGLSKLFLITNRHVVEKNNFAHFKLYHSISPLPNKDIVEDKIVTVNFSATLWEKNWFFPDDVNIDLAITEFDLFEELANSENNYIYYNFLSNNDFIDCHKQINRIERVIYAGYPYGWSADGVDVLPITGGGYTATPVLTNYGGKEEFLIEACMFEGSSGSPICLVKPTIQGGELVNNYYFIGIQYGIANYIPDINNSNEKIRTQLSKCIHARKIEELILNKYSEY